MISDFQALHAQNVGSLMQLLRLSAHKTTSCFLISSKDIIMAIKRQAEGSAARPTKKPRVNDDPNTAPLSKPATQSQPKQIFTSALVADEVDFPRGGGTSLKPIEYKEVRDEARKEADADVEEERRKKRAMVERRNKKNLRGEGLGGGAGKKEKREHDKDEIRESDIRASI